MTESTIQSVTVRVAFLRDILLRNPMVYAGRKSAIPFPEGMDMKVLAESVNLQDEWDGGG
ncbi:MAG: hypothetical protein ACI4S4_00500 [Candidatus Ornithospirochaeta sp.]